MDAPLWYFGLVYGNPGHKAMKKATFQFCGVKPVKIKTFSQIKNSAEEKRNNWLEQAKSLGDNNL